LGFGIHYPKLQNLAKALLSFSHFLFSPPAKAGGNSILEIRKPWIGIRLYPFPNQSQNPLNLGQKFQEAILDKAKEN